MPVTKADLLSLIEDAEQRNFIKERMEKKEAVNNPGSWLRFDPFMYPMVKYKEKVKKDPEFGFEDENTIDRAKDLERAIKGGGFRLAKSLAEFITSGTDFAAGAAGYNPELTKKLDKFSEQFLAKHGNPELLSSQIAEFFVQLGLPTTASYKLLSNVGNLKKLKNFDKFLDKKFGKVYSKTLGTQVAKRAGTGALALGAADMVAMDSERETLFIDKVPEEGKTGKDLAAARLINKIKFGMEGATIGGGFPLVGKGLNVGFKYGIWKPAKFAGQIGAKTINYAVINPVSKGLARVPYLKQGVGLVKDAPGKLYDKTGLPPMKQWNLYTVDDGKALRRILKRADNVVSVLKSIGRQTPEQADVAFKGEKLIKERARTIEKLLDSLERRAYEAVKIQKKMYDSKTTSPASMSKYLDEVMEYLRGQRSLNNVQVPLREVAKEINKITTDIKKDFREVLPKDSELMPHLIGNALKGYWRKSFGVFTNPQYAVDEAGKVFKDAVRFTKKIKSKDLDDFADDLVKREGISKTKAKEEVAADMVRSMLRTAKTDNQDPIQILTRISKEQLDSDKFIATGKELPPEIMKLLGDDANPRSIILQTVSNLSTQSAYKRMFDRLGEVLSKPVEGAANIPGQGRQLFKSKLEAQRGLGIPKGSRGVVQVGKIEGLGLLKSKTSDLWGAADRINRLKNLRGPLDTVANIPIYKQLVLYPKIAAQYGKTVLSPATQTRNFSSAGFFVANRGLLGNRASVTEAFKMMTDDIFAAGKADVKNEIKLIENIREGIKYGALDENIVAAELRAVLTSMQRKGIKSTDELTALLTKGQGGQKWLKMAGEKASRVYAGGDNVWKWYAYNWYKSFLNDYAGKDLGKMQKWFRDVAGRELDLKQIGRRQFETNTEKVDEAIRQAAGWYVRNTMPTYSMVPDLIKFVRVTPLGNFVSFPAEMIRTSFNTLKTNMREMGSDDVILREMGYRGALGQFFALGGASMATKKIYSELTGVSEQLMNAYQAYIAPPFQRNANLIPVSKPEDGRFKVVDLSTFFPYDTISRPVEAAINKFKMQQVEPQKTGSFLMDFFFSHDGPFGELLSPFINRAIWTEALTEVLDNKKKEGGAIYSELDDPGIKFNKALKHIFKSMEPGAVSTGRQLYYGFKEELTPTGGSYDLNDVLFGLGTGIKPLKVDLHRSSDFILGDLSKVKTEAPKTSPIYKYGMSKDDIIRQYVQINRNAWNEQRRIYKALAVAQMLTLPRGSIIKEAKRRKMSMKQVKKALKGDFLPVNFSKPRFKNKIADMKAQAQREGYSFEDRFDVNEIYPKKELNEIKTYLKNSDLNGIFPFDITTDPEPEVRQEDIIFDERQNENQTTSLPQTPPLGPTPTPVVNTQQNVSQINSQSGLTSTETALLSPSEQLIRLKQRNLTS